jgi:hypothetical protein
LRGQTPAVQVKPDRRFAQFLAQAAADQLAHHARGPQSERQFQLFGALVDDPGPDCPALRFGQKSLALPGRNPTPVQQPLGTRRAVAFEPTVDDLPADPDSRRSFRLRQAAFAHQVDRTGAEGFLGVAADAAEVSLFHARNIAGSDGFVM